MITRRGGWELRGYAAVRLVKMKVSLIDFAMQVCLEEQERNGQRYM